MNDYSAHRRERLERDLASFDDETKRRFWLADAAVENGSGEWDYGYFNGGDPRAWVPDLETNRPEEIARWVAYCQAMDHDEGLPAPQRMQGGVCRADQSLGLGSSRFPSDEAES